MFEVRNRSLKTRERERERKKEKTKKQKKDFDDHPHLKASACAVYTFELFTILPLFRSIHCHLMCKHSLYNWRVSPS